MSIRCKHLIEGTPRGVRDSRKCQVQQSATLAWVEDGVAWKWVDRPLKFEAHIRMLLRKPGRTLTDIKWKQLGSETWWRLPAWPDGEATL